MIWMNIRSPFVEVPRPYARPAAVSSGSEDRLCLGHLSDGAPARIMEVRLHDDDRASDVECMRDAVDVTVPYAAKEVRLRLDRRRRGTFGQVEKRAQRPEAVGERHQHAAVHDAAARTALRRPRDAARDLG